jgi:hypothetical protein
MFTAKDIIKIINHIDSIDQRVNERVKQLQDSSLNITILEGMAETLNLLNERKRKEIPNFKGSGKYHHNLFLYHTTMARKEELSNNIPAYLINLEKSRQHAYDSNV